MTSTVPAFGGAAAHESGPAVSSVARLVGPAGAGSSAGILQWLSEPATDRGVWFGEPGRREWRRYPYQRLADLARRTATGLRKAGVGPGDAVVLIHHSSPELVHGFFGAMLLGATPSVLAPLNTFRDKQRYLDHVTRALRLARARAVITAPHTAALVRPAADATGCRVVVDRASEWRPLAIEPTPPRTGLIQLSSGSTGPQRAVRVPLDALETNVAAVGQWLDVTPADVWASWLPLHHDMGLVACLLVAVSAQIDMWLLPPRDFIAAPSRWLECFGRHGATLAMTPNFGLAHVVRRTDSAELAGQRFEGWRALAVGAERIEPAAVRSFVDLLGPYGLRAQTVIAAYGLAEATVGVAGTPLGHRLSSLMVEPSSLLPGGQIVQATHGIPVASCGTPFAGVTVTVVDDGGRALAEDVLGEMEISGPSVAAACVEEDGAERRLGGRVRTGDAGFVHDGQLYVLGRLGDSIKRHGQWLFAEDVQQVAAELSPRPTRTVALLGSYEGRDTAVVAVVGGAGEAASAIGRAVAQHVHPLRALVIAVGPGWLLRTTSGKPRRQAMWQQFLEEAGSASVQWDSSSGAPAPVTQNNADDTEQ